MEGTTRDAIEEYITIGNVTLRLADTAGIRDTDDVVEKIGVQKSMEYIDKSELIIYIADAVSGLDERDYEIINSLKGKKTIALINKTDSGSAVDADELRKHFEYVIEFSVREEKGVAELEAAIGELFDMGSIANDASSVITNARHRDALIKAKTAIDSAINAQECGIPVDTTFIDLEAAASALGEIVGLTVAEEIVDKIFHKFCIGK